MIVKKHIVCDVCGENVGINNPYIIIKQKNYCTNGFEGFTDNKKLHVCRTCFDKVCENITKEQPPHLPLQIIPE